MLSLSRNIISVHFGLIWHGFPAIIAAAAPGSVTGAVTSRYSRLWTELSLYIRVGDDSEITFVNRAAASSW